MSDNPVKRYAVVVNGSFESCYMERAQRSLDDLKEDGYETYLVSQKRLNGADHYFEIGPPWTDWVAKAVDAVKGRIDENDVLVIYTTGRGKPVGLCRTKSRQSEDDIRFIHLLDTLQYSKRTVIMDHCASWSWRELFLDDPRTLFISLGQKERRATCFGSARCRYPSRRFWGKKGIPDLDGDGVISWQERYSNVGEGFFLSSRAYVDEGTPPFSAKVTNVDNGAQLKRELNRLKKGQFAIVNFTSKDPTSKKERKNLRKYEKQFQDMAAEARGQHLFLQTDSKAQASGYGITSFPSVIVFSKNILYDHDGYQFYKLSDGYSRYRPPQDRGYYKLPDRTKALDFSWHGYVDLPRAGRLLKTMDLFRNWTGSCAAEIKDRHFSAGNYALALSGLSDNLNHLKGALRAMDDIVFDLRYLSKIGWKAAGDIIVVATKYAKHPDPEVRSVASSILGRMRYKCRGSYLRCIPHPPWVKSGHFNCSVQKLRNK